MIDKHKWKFVKVNVVPAFKRLLLDRPSPMFVELFVTRRCNLRCSYCWKWRTNHAEPSTREIKERIDKLKEMGCNVISFMGGEPTLRKDLVELTRYCNRKGMFVTMDTNGVILTKKYIDRLSEAGMSSIVVSLDGIKKLKASGKTVENLPHLLPNLEYARKKRKMRIFANLVLTKENIDEVIPLLKLLRRTGVIFTMSLYTKNPECRALEEKNTEYTDKEIERLDKLFDRLIVLKRKGYLIFEPEEYFHKLKEFIRGKHDWHCKAGRHFFAVDADGRFMLCSDAKPIEKNLLDMDIHYFQKYKEEFSKQLKSCNKTCTINFAFCSSYYSDRKLEFLMTSFK